MKLESKNLFSFLYSKPVGIFFSGSLLRYVEIIENKGLNIRAFGEVNLGKNILKDGIIEDEDVFVNGLKSIKNKINSKRIRLSTVDHNISLSVFKNYTKLFKKAGLSLVSIENETDSIIKTLVGEDKRGHFFVNIDTNRSYCMYVLNREIRYMHFIHGSMNSYIKYVADEIDLSTDKAEIVIRKHGLDRSFTSHEYSHAVFFGISFFSEQINNCIIECNTNKSLVGNGAIDHITLLGRGSKLVDFKDYLAQSLNIKVSEPNIWKKLKHKFSDIPEIPFDESLAYVSALGVIVDDWS